MLAPTEGEPYRDDLDWSDANCYRRTGSSFGERKPRVEQATAAYLFEPQRKSSSVKLRTHATKYNTCVFISTAKKFPMARPVDDRCISRKCFTTIQTARHNARTSHTVPSIHIWDIRSWFPPSSTQRCKPEGFFSSGNNNRVVSAM